MNIKINQFEIWIANLNPKTGTESGTIRPVLIVQTNLLNKFHPSTVICPITTNVEKQSKLLRVHLKRGEGNMKKTSDIMIDQIRSIDNRRLIKKVGRIPDDKAAEVKRNIKLIFDIE